MQHAKYDDMQLLFSLILINDSKLDPLKFVATSCD